MLKSSGQLGQVQVQVKPDKSPERDLRKEPSGGDEVNHDQNKRQKM